jgi:hypothetical protein
MILSTLFNEFTVVNQSALFNLIVLFFINLVFLSINTLWLYYGRSKKRNFAFSFLLIGAVVFLLGYKLGDVEIKLGMALGLFAIFGIIRYRTQQMPMREMTHLFTAIGMSVINALAGENLSLLEVLAANMLITGLLFIYERIPVLPGLLDKTIVVPDLERIKPENRARLLEELRESTGLPIETINVQRYNLIKNQATVLIRYRSAFGDESLSKDDDDDE